MDWTVDSSGEQEIIFQLDFSDKLEVSTFRLDRDMVVITLLKPDEFGGNKSGDLSD